jgi:hypothetical protein
MGGIGFVVLALRQADDGSGQFPTINRFYQINICPGVVPLDTVINRIAGRKYDYLHCGVGPDVFNQHVTGLIGQADIYYRDAPVTGSQGLIAFSGASNTADRKARQVETLSHAFSQILIILHDENSCFRIHSAEPPRKTTKSTVLFCLYSNGRATDKSKQNMTNIVQMLVENSVLIG